MFNLRRPALPSDPAAERERIRRALVLPLFGVSVLVAIHVLRGLMSGDFSRLGILPRDLAGLTGILTSPLIHGSWGHLMSNVPALWVLSVLSLYGFPRATRIALPLIWLMGGLGVWLFGREAFHIGASGLTHGLMFFAVVIGIRRRDALSIALALIVLFLYGSMIWGVIPSSPGISFEAHLFGAVIGALCGWFLYRRDPFPVYRRYDWEDEEARDDSDSQTLSGGRVIDHEDGTGPQPQDAPRRHPESADDPPGRS